MWIIYHIFKKNASIYPQKNKKDHKIQMNSMVSWLKDRSDNLFNAITFAS